MHMRDVFGGSADTRLFYFLLWDWLNYHSSNTNILTTDDQQTHDDAVVPRVRLHVELIHEIHSAIQRDHRPWREEEEGGGPNTRGWVT